MQPNLPAGGIARCASVVVWAVFAASHAPPGVASASPAPLRTHAERGALASADPEALKIVVDVDGPIRVTGADLAAAGWDLAAVVPDSLALESAGRPHAMDVGVAHPDHFGVDDRIVFHGRAMTGDYTRENVYWLRQMPGSRAGWVDGAPDPHAPPAARFPATARFELDTVYVASMRRGEGRDRWMWGGPVSAPATVTRSLSLPIVAPESGSVITVTLQGYSQDQDVSGDHHVVVHWNDEQVADTVFEGLVEHTVVASLPAGLTHSGVNALRLDLPDDTGAAADALFLNAVEVSYTGGYWALAGRLDFAAPAAGRHRITVDGFDSPQIAVAQVTDPARPVSLRGAVIRPTTDGTFAVTLTVDAAPESRYVAWQAEAAISPVHVGRNAVSDLRGGGAGADYVVIGHRSLLPAVEALAVHRRGQGMRVAVVDVEDVYDEFAAGVFDPRAIRAFLGHAYRHWPAPRPKYVLLVGESSLDYRGGYGNGLPNLVPTLRIETDLPGALGTVASDPAFVTLEGDDPVPEMLIGRISAVLPAEVEAAVAKTLAFEAAPARAAWRRRGIFVADDDEAPAFEAFSDALSQRFGAGAQHFRAASWPRDRNLAEDIAGAVSAGALVVNYVGHGNVDLWGPWPGGSRIFQNADIGRLANTISYPILTTATCMNGWIDHPLRPQSMAEAWVAAGHGGVAAWAPSGYSFVAGQSAMFNAFYEGLVGSETVTLGALTARAAAAAHAQGGPWNEVPLMFNLLGDPALVIAGRAPPAIHLPTLEVLGLSRRPGPRRAENSPVEGDPSSPEPNATSRPGG